MSFCTIIRYEPITAVAKPTIKARCKAPSPNKNKGANLFAKNAPAFTMPACISADTGLGPSRVNGSHM